MAGTKVVFLVSLPGPSDVNVRAVDSLKGIFGLGRETEVAATLAEPWVALGERLRQLWKCPFLPSSDWDLMPSTPADSESSVYSDSYVLIESSVSSTAACMKRIESALYRDSEVLSVVVIAANTALQILQRFSPSATEDSSVSVLFLDPYEKTCVVPHAFRSIHEISEFLIDTSLRRSEISLFAEREPMFERREGDWDCLKDPHSRKVRVELEDKAEIHSAAREKVEKLAGKITDLMRNKTQKERNCEFTSDFQDDNSPNVVESVLFPSVSHLISDCDQKISAVLTEKRKSAQELQSISSLISAVSSNLSHVRSSIRQFRLTFDYNLSQFHSKADKLAQETKRNRTKLTEMIEKVPKSSVIFTILSVTARPNLMLVASVYTRKQYQIPCFFAIETAGQEPIYRETEIGGSSQPLEIGYVAEFPKEKYKLSIVSRREKEVISNIVDLHLNEPSEVPPLYQSIGNIEEVERLIQSTTGNDAVDAFRSLSSRCSSDNPDSAEKFIQFFLQNCDFSTENLEKSLISEGFSFSS